MNELNEAEQAELRTLLANPVLRKAQAIILEQFDGPIYNLLAPEQSMQLAVEKGARGAFRQLNRLTEPRTPKATPALAQTLKRTKYDK
jgi:hypothetical protein